MKYNNEKMSLKRTIQVIGDQSLSMREASLRTGRHTDFLKRLKVMLRACPFDLSAPETYSESDVKAWIRSYDDRKKTAFHEPDFVSIAKSIAAKQWTRKKAHDAYLGLLSELPKMSLRTFFKRVEALLN